MNDHPVKIKAWRSRNKNAGKIDIRVRFGWLTVVEVNVNKHTNTWRICLLNLCIGA